MNPNNKHKILFIWLIFILTPASVVIFRNVPIAFGEDLIIQINLLQRTSALIAFQLLLSQIYLGLFFSKVVKVFGSITYRAHVLSGILTYTLILIHFISFYLIDFISTGNIDILPKISSNLDWFAYLGRFGFLLLSTSVIVSYFRTFIYFRRIWRLIHNLNYIVYLIIAVHFRFLGSDYYDPVVNLFYFLSVSLYSVILFYKIRQIVISGIKAY